MDKKPKEDDSTAEVVSERPSSNSKIVLIALLTFLLGLGIGWYFGKNVNLTISMEKDEGADQISPTITEEDSATDDGESSESENDSQVEPTSAINETSVQTYTCSNEGIKISLQLPSDWTCKSEESFLTLKSDLFTISMSNLGRGGPCPMGDDAPECVATDFYTRGDIKIETYTAGPDSKSIFGSLDDSNPEVGITWIEIGYPDMVSRELTPSEKTELFGVLDSIKMTN
ncbi:hypothetical protein HY469_04930 [Candidatus Roizmanbacteria bacterium]|nr:hypothetical protein [Candidatus Roizmanbacteria bacterium]